jgi:hypothetical protein
LIEKPKQKRNLTGCENEKECSTHVNMYYFLDWLVFNLSGYLSVEMEENQPIPVLKGFD